jgi:DNA polymerase-3 subunit epsilon
LNQFLTAAFPSLAFVDLETTGATATADRITEIGIIIVDADGVREWSTLVNPQTRISDFIVGLTGITNAMVEDAPTFDAVADEVLDLLRGRTFIAHNARFDYGFLKNEFARLERDFRAPVLCTVKLSRVLQPQHHRHNLDTLIARHGLTVTDRHRALGDAKLIWQLWQKLFGLFSGDEIEAAVKRITARPSLPPNLDPTLVDQLPDGSGVYLFHGENDLPLYIGKANNIKKRVLSHFGADVRNAKEMSLSQQVRRITWIETGGEIGALLQEAALVKRLQPTHNRHLRKNGELCSWRIVRDEAGEFRPQLVYARDVAVGMEDDLFGLYTGRAQAAKALRAIADAHELCHAILGLDQVKPGKPCFAHQLKQCRGACVGKEAPGMHGARLLAAMAKEKVRGWPYAQPVGIREGKEVHVVHGWRYLGTARSDDDVWELLEADAPDFDLDTYRILLKALPKAQVVPLARPA